MSAANGFMLLGNPRVQTSVSLITQLKAKHGSFKVWCAGCLLALVIVTPPALWAAGVFKKTTAVPPPEYAAYNSLTYTQYYTGTEEGRAAWPMSGDTPSPAMQACGMINTPLWLNNGQCAVYSQVGDQVCTPFAVGQEQNEATPGCKQNALVTDDIPPGNPPILFRDDGTTASFAATATHIYPYGEGAIDIKVINAEPFAAGMTITGASMPFTHDGETYAVVTTTILGVGGIQIRNLNASDFFGKVSSSLQSQSSEQYQFAAHAATVKSFGPGDLTLALLYEKKADQPGTAAAGQYLGFYNLADVECDPGQTLISCSNPFPNSEPLLVFPASVEPAPNNADLAFDSTDSYVLATLGPMFALVAVPKGGKAAETLFTLGQDGWGFTANYKAAFATPPPSGGGVRPPQLFVVAESLSVGFYDVTATDATKVANDITFTADGTTNTAPAAFATEDAGIILNVEWSTLDEVIVYRKNSLQIVKVPDAVLAKYYGVETQTYGSLFGDDLWPSDGVAYFAACGGVDINKCFVYREANIMNNFNRCNRHQGECSFESAKIVAHYESDWINFRNSPVLILKVGNPNHINFWDSADYSPFTSLPADGDNDVVITGASDVWQDGNTYYALITTATDVAIYDLKTGDKTPVLDGVALAGYAAAADLVPITNGEITMAETSVAVLYKKGNAASNNEIVIELMAISGKMIGASKSMTIANRKFTGTESGTLTFDATGNYILATLDSLWALVDFNEILHQSSALSNVQVAFSPSPDTFTTASGGTIIEDGIFKQLYVVATKDKLEWYSVDQPGTLLASIDGLNTPENDDDIVSVQWLTQHEVVLFRSTSGRQHVPVPGKVFNVDRDDVIGLYYEIIEAQAVTCVPVLSGVPEITADCPSATSFPSIMCPAMCSTVLGSRVDVDHYATQNQLLEEMLTAKANDDKFKRALGASCTTIDCNILDATLATADQLQNGALVAQFLCPETCKAPLALEDWPDYIRVSGACDTSDINGNWAISDTKVGQKSGLSLGLSSGKIVIQDTYKGVLIAEFESILLPMGTRTWQVDCTPTDDTDNKTPWQVTIVAAPPPPPPTTVTTPPPPPPP